MRYLPLLCLLFLAACSGGNRIRQSVARQVLADGSAEVRSLEENSDKTLAWYTTPGGKKVLLQKINRPAGENREAPRRIMADTVVAEMAVAARGSRPGADDPFRGSIRATPKTTYSTKRQEKFATIPALYRKLPSADHMKSLGIGRREERVPEEDRNVHIRKAYLYTITVEDDNDLHLLIGNTPVYKEGVTRVFNAEISGVPPNGTAAEKEAMRKLRAKAILAMGDIPLCGRNGYLQAHRRLSIRGSLFFDSHHASKPARCREVEGESAWEIHPVKDIKLDVP